MINILSKAKKDWARMSCWEQKSTGMTYQEYELSKLDTYLNEQHNINTVEIIGLKDENAALQAHCKKSSKMLTELRKDKKAQALKIIELSKYIGKQKKELVHLESLQEDMQKYIKRLAEIRKSHKKEIKEVQEKLAKLKVLYRYSSVNSNFIVLEKIKAELESKKLQIKTVNRLFTAEVAKREKFTKSISNFLNKDITLATLEKMILGKGIL
jgi:hypothetical protein